MTNPSSVAPNLQTTSLYVAVAKCLNDSHGYSADEVEHFMTVLEVPQSAKGLWTVSTRINREIASLLRQSRDGTCVDFCNSVLPICVILENSAEVFSAFPDFRLQPNSDKPNERPGFLLSSPLYGTLWKGCDFSQLIPQYSSLRAHFAAGYLEFSPELQSRPHVLQIASTHIRRLGSQLPESECEARDRNALVRSALQQLPTTWVGRKQFAHSLNDIAQTVSLQQRFLKEVESLEYVADIISGRLPDERPRTKGNHNGTGVESGPVWGGFGEPLALPRNVDEQEFFLLVERIGGDSDPEHLSGLDSGLDQADIRESELEIRIPNEHGALDTDRDRIYHIGNSHLAEVVAMANQMFPFSRSQLDDDGLSHLIAILEHLPESPKNPETLETIALLKLHLITGQSIERCHAAVLGCADTTDQLTVDLDRGTYSFTPWHPSGHAKPAAPLTLRLPTSTAITLRDLQRRPGSDQKRLFNFDFRILAERIKRGIRKTNGDHGYEISLTAIGKVLYQTITQLAGGDQSPAILITGALDHGGYVPATYSRWPTENLRAVHESAIARMLKKPLNEIFGSSTRKTTQTFGSTFVPTTAKIANFVRQAIAKVTSTQQLPPRGLGLIETQEAYAAYVHSMFAFATGWRPATAPLPDMRLIDMSTGFAQLSDKDTPDAYHTHLVWLPPVCISQLVAYQTHLALLAERLVFLNSDAPEQLLREPGPKLTISRDMNRQGWKQNPQFLFGIQLDGSRYQLPPKRIKEFWDGHSEISKNGQRHFVRNALLDGGASDEVTRATMGHWRLGEESLGKFSGLDPLAMRRTLESILPNVMKRQGWVVLKSPLLKK